MTILIIDFILKLYNFSNYNTLTTKNIFRWSFHEANDKIGVAGKKLIVLGIFEKP